MKFSILRYTTLTFLITYTYSFSVLPTILYKDKSNYIDLYSNRMIIYRSNDSRVVINYNENSNLIHIGFSKISHGLKDSTVRVQLIYLNNEHISLDFEAEVKFIDYGFEMFHLALELFDKGIDVGISDNYRIKHSDRGGFSLSTLTVGKLSYDIYNNVISSTVSCEDVIEGSYENVRLNGKAWLFNTPINCSVTFELKSTDEHVIVDGEINRGFAVCLMKLNEVSPFIKKTSEGYLMLKGEPVVERTEDEVSVGQDKRLRRKK
jgi:hypothetical protein